MGPDDVLSIGDLARRTGLSVPAIRFYEAQGLVAPARSPGGQRRFRRSDIRRLSFVRVAQMLGLSLSDIAAELRRLPGARTPDAADWGRISRAIRGELDRRIAALERTRARLDGCIGCGCLSLKSCALYNPDDQAARGGDGPRYLLGDNPPKARRS
jgi:MerR family transcriptional regulator, redox-sensitive transcriptional activator SoxR